MVMLNTDKNQGLAAQMEFSGSMMYGPTIHESMPGVNWTALVTSLSPEKVTLRLWSMMLCTSLGAVPKMRMT